MSSERERPSVRFEPLHPATRGQIIAAFVLGPVLWLVALIAAAWILDYGEAIVLGLLVAVGACLVALILLALVHAGRERERRRYAHGR